MNNKDSNPQRLLVDYDISKHIIHLCKRIIV